jgi:hypothetical protein
MRGIQMGEISKLGWLMGFVEHAMPEDGNRSSFRNVVFSVCRNPDDEQSPED